METLLDEVLAKYSIKETAERLNICTGTINRWKELHSVPSHYQFDLYRILDKDIDYSSFSAKEKDQFYTPPHVAKHCWDVFCDITHVNTHEFTFIEPSAGSGSFLQVLPPDTIAMDIDPRIDSIQRQDYLTWNPPDDGKRYIVFGNPPFGLRGHIALQFINHSEFAEYICFILPQLFESDGKGSPRKRVHGFHLIHSEKISTPFYTPDNTEVDVNVVFQIWSKHTSNPEYNIQPQTHSNLKVYSLSDGGTVSTTRNKKMIGHCDIYLPSTCFGKDSMRVYDSFEELPNRKGYGVVFHEDKKAMIEKAKKIDWSELAFLSTNSALNLRTSIIHSQFGNE